MIHNRIKLHFKNGAILKTYTNLMISKIEQSMMFKRTVRLNKDIMIDLGEVQMMEKMR